MATAARLAVSARNISFPNDANRQPVACAASNSLADHPPSGPIITVTGVDVSSDTQGMVSNDWAPVRSAMTIGGEG